MPKKVLDVGQCDMDHASIRQLIESHFDATVIRAHGAEDALKQLRDGPFDLVMINRKLDRDQSDGIDIVKTIKAADDLASVPVMIITNFDDHQERAVSAGAVLGFGKADLTDKETEQRLRQFLDK